MRVRIRAIRDPGNLEKERVVMEVHQDTDIGLYVVFETVATQGENTVSNRVDRTYWFPDHPVKAKDLVVLYTKEGRDSEHKNDDGTTSYFFYWALSAPLWANEIARVVLLEATNWQVKGVETAKQGVERGA